MSLKLLIHTQQPQSQTQSLLGATWASGGLDRSQRLLPMALRTLELTQQLCLPSQLACWQTLVQGSALPHPHAPFLGTQLCPPVDMLFVLALCVVPS